MSQRPFLEATGQARKLFVAIGLSIAIGAVLGWVFLYAQLTDDVVLLIPALVVGALILGIWLCLSIRCPRCKAKIVWIAVSRQSTQTWLFWLLQLTSCPKCNFDPCEPSDSSPPVSGSSDVLIPMSAISQD
jgi:hypothetical protein